MQLKNNTKFKCTIKTTQLNLMDGNVLKNFPMIIKLELNTCSEMLIVIKRASIGSKRELISEKEVMP